MQLSTVSSCVYNPREVVESEALALCSWLSVVGFGLWRRGLQPAQPEPSKILITAPVALVDGFSR